MTKARSACLEPVSWFFQPLDEYLDHRSCGHCVCQFVLSELRDVSGKLFKIQFLELISFMVGIIQLSAQTFILQE